MKIKEQTPVKQPSVLDALGKTHGKARLKVVSMETDRVDGKSGRARAMMVCRKPEPMALEISTTFGKSLSELADVLDEPTKK